MKQNHRSKHSELSAASANRRIGKFYSTALLFVLMVGALGIVNAITTPGHWWIVWPALGFGLALLFRGWHLLVTPRFIGASSMRRGNQI